MGIVPGEEEEFKIKPEPASRSPSLMVFDEQYRDLFDDINECVGEEQQVQEQLQQSIHQVNSMHSNLDFGDRELIDLIGKTLPAPVRIPVNFGITNPYIQRRSALVDDNAPIEEESKGPPHTSAFVSARVSFENSVYRAN